MFNLARANRARQFLSKLAALELCGWIEETFDKIFLTYGTSRLVTRDCLDEFASSVERTYGFDYKKNLKPLFVKIMGLKGFEKLETNFGPADIATLKSLLGTLKTIRDSHAHTHTKGVIPNVVSPSVIIGNLNSLHPFLLKLEREVKRIR